MSLSPWLLMGSNSFVPPVAPVWGGGQTMTAATTPVVSATIAIVFDTSYRTGTVSLSTGGSFVFSYFASTVSSAQVSDADYEVYATSSTSVSGHNFTKNGGESALGVWVSLDTPPVYSWTCSGRRGGAIQVTIQMRSKIDNAITASRVFTLTQTSDAVSPTFGGGTSASLTLSSAQTMTQGVYIDDGSSANAGRIRNYRDGTLVDNTGWTFNTGSISESEYELISAGGGVSPPGIASFSGIGSNGNIATLRTNSASASSGPRASGFGSSGSGTINLSITIRHEDDRAKSATQFFSFTKTVT